MSAEAFKDIAPVPVNPALELAAALGEIATSRTPIEATGSSPEPGARRRTLVASQIKGNFQKVDTRLNADQRDAARAGARADSVRYLFKMYGIIPPNPSKSPGETETGPGNRYAKTETDLEFDATYQEAEVRTTAMDRTKLFELFEKYDSHPLFGVFDTLKSASNIDERDLTLMRRTSVALFETYAPDYQIQDAG